jgi:hypothetical protein
MCHDSENFLYKLKAAGFNPEMIRYKDIQKSQSLTDGMWCEAYPQGFFKFLMGQPDQLLDRSLAQVLQGLRHAF